jgi:hypothetical protein
MVTVASFKVNALKVKISTYKKGFLTLGLGVKMISPWHTLTTRVLFPNSKINTRLV